MSDVECAVHAAIAMIDGFLTRTAHSSAEVTADELRSLSNRIRQTRDGRSCASAAEDAKLRPLQELYRTKLEQLRIRLRQTEIELRCESDRLAEENDRLTSVRDWHGQFTATQ